MKIAIGSDHAGFNLKNSVVGYIESLGYQVKDFGIYEKTSCDYPDIAFTVAEAVARGDYQRGILICGTGLGMAIAANKVNGIRAVTCTDAYSAEMSVNHNNANILTFGERVVGEDIAFLMVKTWLEASFLGGRHKSRVDKINAYSKKNEHIAIIDNALIV